MYSIRQQKQTEPGLTPPIAKQEAGFTIIELLVATAVFSLTLLICATTIIFIGRAYYKGVTTAKTETAARSIMDDISGSVQFSGEQPSSSPQSPAPSVNVFCLGNKRYNYILDREQEDNPSSNAADKQSRHVLWRDTMTSASASSCQALDLNQPTPSDANSTGDGRELLGSNMRLTKFSIQPIGTSRALYQVDVWVVYGDEDLLNPATGTGSRNCKDGGIGTQFCAASELTTIVQRRLK